MMNKKEETKQIILEKSASIFNTKGISGTAMSDIMEATKLSKGTMYVHFESKEELVKQAVDYNLNKLGTEIFLAINKETSARKKLFAYIDKLSTPLNPPVVGGCPMLNFGTEADDTNMDVKYKINGAVNYSQQIISDIIKKGIEEGEFKADWGYNEFATIMFAMIEGGQLICRVGDSNAKMKVISTALKKMIEEQRI